MANVRTSIDIQAPVQDVSGPVTDLAGIAVPGLKQLAEA